jgi:low temperature requirement protein LtrA
MRDDYRPLAAAPQLHQDWDDPQDEERSVTWPELFFDLFFVAAISNLSHLFDERPDAPNAGGVCILVCIRRQVMPPVQQHIRLR